MHDLQGNESAAKPGGARTAEGRPRGSGQGDLAQRLAALPDLSTDQLRAEWRRLFRSQPPRLSPDLMQRAIAHRLQELAHGGLAKAAKRKLASLAEGPRDERPLPDAGRTLRPGARLVREWHGRTHVVVIREDGFEYAGQLHRSLTKIARQITGSHWSGPRFFGLSKAGQVSAGEGDRTEEVAHV
jgi:hypothetical protein